MARGRSRGRPRKGEEESEKEETSNAFEALEELQDLGFSQEEVVEMLRKAKNDRAVEKIQSEVAEGTKSMEGEGVSTTNPKTPSRSWAEIVEESEGPIGTKGSWADVAKANRRPQNGISLQYTKPGEVVKFTRAELVEGARLWNNTLVGMVVGTSLSYAEVAKYARSVWSDKGLGKIHQLRKGIYLFEFRSEEERGKILEGFWAIYSRFPLLLKPWQAGVSLDDHFKKIPIWIQLPNLKLDLWGENLGKVASFVGVPVTTDACTASRSRIDYARVLVEVPLMGKLPETIPLQDDDGPVYHQQVVYEWKPVACGVCGWFGHDGQSCKRRREFQGSTSEGSGMEKKEVVKEVPQVAVEEGIPEMTATVEEEVEKGNGKTGSKGNERQEEGSKGSVGGKNTAQPTTQFANKEKQKQITVSKSPIIQNLPQLGKSKKGENGKQNGGKKTTNHPNG